MAWLYLFITDIIENVLLVQQTCLVCHRICICVFFYVLMACNSSGKGLCCVMECIAPIIGAEVKLGIKHHRLPWKPENLSVFVALQIVWRLRRSPVTVAIPYEHLVASPLCQLFLERRIWVTVDSSHLYLRDFAVQTQVEFAHWIVSS